MLAAGMTEEDLGESNGRPSNRSSPERLVCLVVVVVAVVARAAWIEPSCRSERTMLLVVLCVAFDGRFLLGQPCGAHMI